MFRGLFGTNSDRPTPPKNQIEVVCPACGAAQYEPRLVVSTFCKKCGVHLSIHKRKVTASNVTRSGAAGMDSLWETPTAGSKAQPAPLPATQAVDVPPPLTPDDEDVAPELITPLSSEEAEQGGFGVFLKQQATSVPLPGVQAPDVNVVPVDPPTGKGVLRSISEAVVASLPSKKAEEPTSENEGIETEEPKLKAEPIQPPASRRPQSNSPPPTPAPAPMTQSTLQKMKDQGMYRNQYFKDAECFDCNHKFKVSRSSKSANCPNCGAYVSMEDVEINMASTLAVKTRGDVLVRKRGHLSTASVHCKDLRCYGIMEANVTTTGDAIYKTTGTIIGEVRCRRFVIEKGTDVTFMNTVYAEEVDIQARVTATIFSTGPILINSNGAVNGDVTARSVSIEPGGELNGAMNIVRSQTMPRPNLAES